MPNCAKIWGWRRQRDNSGRKTTDQNYDVKEATLNQSALGWGSEICHSFWTTGIYRSLWHISFAVAYFAQFGIYFARWWNDFWLCSGCFYELRVNEFRKLLLKHYHKLPLSHIEHDTKSHFNHPLPKHPKTDFFNNLMSYTSQALREGMSNFCENFQKIFREFKISI